jgi:hypothetical protein
MLSDEEGFYIQAPIKKIKNNEAYEFSCHHFVKKEDRWISQKLFSFEIPSKYITGLHRLHESIEPFLPKYVDNSIYFNSWNNQIDQFQLYQYHRATKEIDEIFKTYRDRQQVFAPYICKNEMYCGLILPEQETIELTQRNFIEQNNRFELPHCTIK